MCPDGASYKVSDKNDGCYSLNCEDGVVVSCNRYEGPCFFQFFFTAIVVFVVVAVVVVVVIVGGGRGHGGGVVPVTFI